jgi:hypothetical protein
MQFLHVTTFQDEATHLDLDTFDAYSFQLYNYRNLNASAVVQLSRARCPTCALNIQRQIAWS